jgi:predicted MFS family arabinose efflux permease
MVLLLLCCALGGVLTSTVGWPAIFYMNLPVVIAGVLLAPRILPATRKGSDPSTLRSHKKPCSGRFRIIKGSDPLRSPGRCSSPAGSWRSR